MDIAGINRSDLARLLNIDRANITMWIKKREIPKSRQKQIIDLLQPPYIKGITSKEVRLNLLKIKMNKILTEIELIERELQLSKRH